MKKIFIGLALSITFLLITVYLFIPGKRKMVVSVEIKAALNAVSRQLMTENNWHKWWPGDTVFTYNNNEYKIQRKILNAIEIEIKTGHDSINSRMEIVLLNTDSVLISWLAEQSAGNNPFKRFTAYRHAKHTRQNMQIILDRLKSFMENEENVYGFSIHETIVVDSVLITTKRSFDHKPGVKEINEMIQSLKKYIAVNKAEEKNYPMLNVTMIDSQHYEVMTAIPVDRYLPGTKDFVSKFMLKGGKILEAQIQGGPYTIENAFNEFENFRTDHAYKSPAIPYQLMITDRAKETDTTKWITKLYYPVL